MNDSESRRSEIGELLHDNKAVILTEILLVLLPVYFGLLIDINTGRDNIPLTGNVVLLGGPVGYLGMMISLVLLAVSSRLRGAAWRDYGVSKPKKWIIAVLQGLGVSLVVFVVVKFLLNPLVNSLSNVPPRDMSRFTPLTGNLPNLIIQLVNVWLTAGFWEEFVFRGYLTRRIMDLLGKETTLNWIITLIVSSVIFGLAHPGQGPVGVLKTAVIGLVFAISYLVVGRNLWPLILSHAFIDSLDMVSHYFGG